VSYQPSGKPNAKIRTYVKYTIEISSRYQPGMFQSWIIKRRYSDFSGLHKVAERDPAPPPPPRAHRALGMLVRVIPVLHGVGVSTMRSATLGLWTGDVSPDDFENMLSGLTAAVLQSASSMESSGAPGHSSPVVQPGVPTAVLGAPRSCMLCRTLFLRDHDRGP